jgi:hypothetical protein
MSSFDSWLSRLSKELNRPSGIADSHLMNALSWVERYTPDKRNRPPESKQALAWIAENGLMATYKRDFELKKPDGRGKASKKGKGVGGHNKKPPTSVISIRLPDSLIKAYGIDRLWVVDAIQRKIEKEGEK